MNRIQLLLLIIISYVNIGLSQSDQIEHYVDSLFLKVNHTKSKSPILALSILDTIQSLVKDHNIKDQLAPIYFQRWAVYDNQEDTIKSKLYQDSLKYIYKTKAPDDTYYYYLFSKAVNWHRESDFDSAMLYYNRINDNIDFTTKNYYDLKTYSLTNMASVQRKLGNYDESVSYLEEGIHIAENYKGEVEDIIRKSRLFGLYNGMGLIYRRTREYEKAVEMYKKAESFKDTLDPSRYNASLNIINSLMYLERFDEALKKSEEIYPHLNKLKSKQRFNFYCDRARISVHAGYLEMAKVAIQEARKIQHKYNINPQAILGIECEYFYKKKDYNSAKRLYKAYDAIIPSRNRNSKITALKGWIKSDLAQNSNELLPTFNLYDSLIGDNYKKNLESGIQEWEIKYETLAKDREIDHLRQENKIQSLKLFRNRLGLFFLGLCTILIGIAFFYYKKFLQKARETNKFLDEQRQELYDKNQSLQRKVGNWDIIRENFYAIPGRENRKIKLKDILYIASDGNEVIFYTPQKKYRAWLRLKDLEQDLPSDHFTRSHRSYIINIHHVSFENNQYLLISNGDQVSLSKSYKKKVEQLYTEIRIK